MKIIVIQMAYIPNRRGRFFGSRSNSSLSSSSNQSRDGSGDGPSNSRQSQQKPSVMNAIPEIPPLQLQERHHRHSLDHSYFPEGNDDMNANTLFPNIPVENHNDADRVYADPYRRNIYIFNRNGQEMFFEEEETGLINRSSSTLTGLVIPL